MSPTNTIPDPYRDNEHHVDNFADHIRAKAAQEQISVTEMAQKEIHRFRDVVFGVNTQFSGAQLRLRDAGGKVISKLKKNTKIKILNSTAVLDVPDNDRGQGQDDSHIFVLIEADAADTEAGGTGKVQGWVSTEYINSLSEPVEPVVIDPVLDNPDSWGSNPIDEPDPFKVVDEAKKEKPERTSEVPPLPVKPEAESSGKVPPLPDEPESETTSEVPPLPVKPEAESSGKVPPLPDEPESETTSEVPPLPPERAADQTSNITEFSDTIEAQSISVENPPLETKKTEPAVRAPDLPQTPPAELEYKTPTTTETTGNNVNNVSWWTSTKNWFASIFTKKTETTVTTIDPTIPETYVGTEKPTVKIYVKDPT